MAYDLVICISDLHSPYGHPDTIAFLKAIKDKYWSKAKNPCCTLLGDEADFHAISFHDHSPDLMSPSDELKTAINRLKPIYNLFPKAYVLESNHGSMIYRKQSHHGLPRFVIKSYRDVLEAPKDWHWVKDLTLKLSDGTRVYFHHGKSADVTKLSQTMSMNAVQGHFHEKFTVEYWANPNGLFWGMQIGCLIHDDSLAFSYNNINLKRPIIGTGIILNGQPKLIPMILNSKGRWIKELR
jgi:hypothetical protein